MNASNTWTSSSEHPGYRCKVIQRGACTIQILRPELEPEEKRRREAHTQAVTERVLRDYYTRKERKEKTT